MKKSRIFGPIDLKINNLNLWDKTVLLTEVFANLPTRWHGECVKADELLPYIHPDIVSEKGIAQIKEMGAIKISTPLLGPNFKNYMSDALVDGVEFHKCADIVAELYSYVTYIELMAAKYLCSREQFFAHIFEGVNDRDVATKYVFKKRVKIDIPKYVEMLESGKIKRAQGVATIVVGKETIKSFRYIASFIKEIVY